MHLDVAVVFDGPSFRNSFTNWLTREWVVPTRAARTSWLIFGTIGRNWLSKLRFNELL